MTLLLLKTAVKIDDIMYTCNNKLKPILKSSVLLTLIVLLTSSICLALQTTNTRLLLNKDYFPEVKRIINDSRSSIKMLMFEASYYEKFKNSPSNRLINALIKARKRGVEVEVILDIRQKGDRTTIRNLVTAKRLTNAGVKVILDTKQVTTHCKLLIIDEKTVVIGSTNWTYSALTSNHESSIVLESRQISAELLGYFERIKRTGQKYSNF